MSAVLVTGHTGFIGSHLCRRLSKIFSTVVGLSTTRGAYERCINYVGTVDDQSIVNRIFKDNYITHVVNLAANIAERKSQCTGIGVTFPISALLEAAAKSSTLQKYIQIGSTEEYGVGDGVISERAHEEPVNAYGLKKLTETQQVIHLNSISSFPGVVLRPTIVYGPMQRSNMFLPSLIGTLARCGIFKMSPGTQLRDFIYIDDLIDAICMSLTGSVNGNIYNVSYGRSVRLIDIAQYVCVAMGSDLRSSIVVDSNIATDYDMRDVVVSSQKIRESLGWRPHIDVETGLKRTIDFYKAQIA